LEAKNKSSGWSVEEKLETLLDIGKILPRYNDLKIKIITTRKR
jgi:hypothetical protein